MAKAAKPTTSKTEPTNAPAASAPPPTYQAHRFADLLPEMSAQEFEDLKKSIETVGLQEPITLYQGKILDGRNRYRACLELGIPPAFSGVAIKDDAEAVDYVITRNLQRRNLTAGQKAVVAIKALPEISKAVQDERVKKIRDAIAAKRIDGKRANLPSSDKPEKKRGRKKEIKVTSIAGDLFGVSATYVRYAEALKDKDEKLLDEVITGRKRLYALYKKHCPTGTTEKKKRGPKPNLIRRKLGELIRLLQKESMPAVLAKLEEAQEALAAAQSQDKSEAGGGAAKSSKG